MWSQSQSAGNGHDAKGPSIAAASQVAWPLHDFQRYVRAIRNALGICVREVGGNVHKVEALAG